MSPLMPPREILASLAVARAGVLALDAVACGLILPGRWSWPMALAGALTTTLLRMLGA